MKISLGVFILILFYFSFVSSALADEYQCSAMWSVGTYSGKGDSLHDAIDEAREYGTPAIFIPIKGHFEQEDNAKDRGFVYEDIDRIEELIVEKIDEKRNPVKSKGAQNAANIIKDLLG